MSSEATMIRSGLIGRSILSSKSPWLHEQEAKAQGLDLSYELFDFTQRGLPDEALPEFLRDLAAQGYAGVNITYPFKQLVMPVLDDLSEGAEMVGAVNTVAIRDGRMTGYNTDMEGFRDSLVHGLAGARQARALLMGAGGAGAAVASALLSLDFEMVAICDADPVRADQLVERLAERASPGRVVTRRLDDLSTDDVDGIVNATPIGMAAHPGTPLPTDLLRPDHWVADIIYFPIETELLRVAQSKGCRTMNGSGMVIGQAARAFEIISGHAADQSRMARSFVAA